jgi:hypothetical protein
MVAVAVPRGHVGVDLLNHCSTGRTCIISILFHCSTLFHVLLHVLLCVQAVIESAREVIK